MLQILKRISHPWPHALRLMAFWLLFFAFFRLWFILWLRADWGAEKPWQALWQAMPLDLSMAGYLVAIPIAFWFIAFNANEPVRRFFTKVIRAYTISLLLILVFVFGANVFIYEAWHTLLNNRALEYFRTPEVMFDSMSPVFILGSAMTYIALVWLWWRIYNFFAIGHVSKATAWNFAWAPVFIALLFLIIRGGFGKMPINESAVYYSAHSFNNHAATNTAWHMVHSLIETRSTENHYRVFPATEAKSMVDELYRTQPKTDTAANWLIRKPGTPPNIVFILMESMTAQLLEELGGEKGVCPNLSRLADTGMLFENIYSSGYRTDQGLVSILGGFPAQPDQSVVLLEDKAAHLPSLPKELRKHGYATSFFYGGQLTFANIGVWLRNQQFEDIISERDFSQKENTQRWGADDGQVFQKAISKLHSLEQPFFTTILTLSLHTPYDVPFNSRPVGNTEREKFLNSAAFADWAIGQFFEHAAHEPWFENTLFVLVADHGHSQPAGIWMDNPRARQVPLIFTGPLIRPEWRGKRISKVGNHHDIPATLLHEIGLPTQKFTWSKDLCDPQTSDFAYYTNENGLGWLSSKAAGFYWFSDKRWQNYKQTNLNSADQKVAEAFLQTLYQEFLDL